MSDDAVISMEVNQRDLLDFENTLVEFAAIKRKSMAEVLRAQARLVAVNLAWNTQPYGLDANARNVGERAVLRDVGRVYRSLDVVFGQIARTSYKQAQAFYAAAMKGDLSTAKRILREVGLLDYLGADIGKLDPGLHDTLRNNRGRVRTRTPRQIVTDPKKLVALQRKLLAHVGTAKSSWASCAAQLGGMRGIPHWATRNKAGGVVEDLTGGFNPRVILHSRVDYMPTVCPPGMRRDAVEKQRNKMQEQIRLTLEKSARQSRLAA